MTHNWYFQKISIFYEIHKLSVFFIKPLNVGLDNPFQSNSESFDQPNDANAWVVTESKELGKKFDPVKNCFKRRASYHFKA